MSVTLVCPLDLAPLREGNAGQLVCSACGNAYRVEHGVARLVDNDDTFYEGAYENQVHFRPGSERPWHIWPLWLINSGYPWAVRRHVPAGSIVVELGCAAGVNYFGDRYRMVGCDISYASLLKLEHYQHRVQADAASCIPLPDNSADAVVSSYFWEHISPSTKPRMLAECQRVLRPGGKLVFLYDVETENPLIRYFKGRFPELYNRLFLEGDGHIGYQTPGHNIELFEAAGFRVQVHNGMEKTWLQSPSAYIKLAQFPVKAAVLLKPARALGNRLLFVPYTVLMRIVDRWICPLLPARWARIDLVVAEKPLT